MLVERLQDAEIHVHGLIVSRCGVGGVIEQRAERGFHRQKRSLHPLELGVHEQRAHKARRDGLAITLGARKLAGNIHGGVDAAQAQIAIEQARGLDERVAMHDAITRELGVLQTGDHAEDAFLLAKCEIRLEAHQIVGRALGVFGTKLHRRPRATTRCRIGKPHGLASTESGCVGALAGDFLNRLARLEQVFRFEVALNNAIGGNKLRNEGVIALFVERRVQVIAGSILLVARLAEQHIHVKGIGHDHGRRCVKECEIVRAGFVNKPLSKRIARKRARCQNGSIRNAQGSVKRIGNAHHAIFDIRVFLHHGSDVGGELVSVDRKRTTRVDAASARRRNKLRTERRKLRLQHAGSAFGLGALQGVRAHELGAIAAAMHIGFGFGAHLEQTHMHAALGELKRGLAACETRADYVHKFIHAGRITHPHGNS